MLSCVVIYCGYLHMQMHTFTSKSCVSSLMSTNRQQKCKTWYRLICGKQIDSKRKSVFLLQTKYYLVVFLMGNKIQLQLLTSVWLPGLTVETSGVVVNGSGATVDNVLLWTTSSTITSLAPALQHARCQTVGSIRFFLSGLFLLTACSSWSRQLKLLKKLLVGPTDKNQVKPGSREQLFCLLKQNRST